MELVIKQYLIQHYLYLASTPSTNEFLTNVSSISNPNTNYCIYTYNQTEGRGQIGRKWYTGADQNLASSFYFKVYNLDAKDQFLINMMTCLAIYKLIKSYLPNEPVSIKWPNDMYIGDKKLAGILIQNQIKGNKISHTTIGIGVNINSLEFPEDIPNPVSLNHYIRDEKGINKLEFLHALSKNLSDGMNFMILRDMKKEYTSKLYRLNETHSYRSAEDGLFEGRILDISQDGKLRMDTPRGIQEYAFREVNYII